MTKDGSKVALITGATSGIGAVTALELARLGYNVVGVGRSERECFRMTQRIRNATGNGSVEFLPTDLSSQSEVRDLAKRLNLFSDRLDVLVNNAGGYFAKRQVSVDGIEMTFALNHLAYMQLTMLLLERLKVASGARIVNVASAAHRGASIDFEDLLGEKQYDRLIAYRQSKLANILFTYELARRLQGSKVTVNALHPGVVRTNLGANNGWLRARVRNIVMRRMISPGEGAKTSIYLASSPDVEGITGKYFIDCCETPSSPASYDQEVAAHLWDVSMKLLGLREEISVVD
ncbi:MAG: SDR family oxidoreductase [Bacteroidota bacterium]